MIPEPTISFLSVLILIGAAQGLFLVLTLVFMRRGSRRANLFLAALVLTLSILLIDGFMNVTNYYSRYPHLFGVVWPLNFLIGPFLYFYVRELSSPKQRVFSWRHLVHFLPMTLSALFLLYSVSVYKHMPGWACAGCTSPMSISIAPLEGTRMIARNVASLLVSLQKVVYYTWSFILVSAYGSRIKQSFSSLEKISLSWLRTLLLLFFSLCILFTFFSFFAAPLGINRETGYFFYLGMTGVTYVMAFKAVLHPAIFSQIETAHKAELIRTEEIIIPAAAIPSPEMPQEANGMMSTGKYQKSLLTDERAAAVARRLLDLMETKKPYLEPELTLPELAEKLSIFPHHLSQVINREMNKSFFDFVNEYRVREAKRLLSSPQFSHYSVLGIALDAGFNSKSAFYTAFGKHAGMTPSEFRKRRQSVWSKQKTEPDLQGRA
jgi:AraC-like DNA-binding protein